MLRPYPWQTTCYPAAALLAGLLTAQIIAALQVYLSNISLYNSLSAIAQAGYLPIPNQQTMEHLREPIPAVYGGLFFTLSTGAGISLLSFAAAWVWDRGFSRNPLSLVPLLLVWAGAIVAVNWKGISPMATAYFAVIPAVVFWITLRQMPLQGPGTGWPSALVHLTAIILLASLWAPQLNNDIFLDFRDRLLLSNAFGAKINDFYYRYTLYPAEVFKSLDQKLLKTASLDSIEKKPLKALLQAKLLRHDYLPMEGKEEVDLKISESGGDLIFENKGEAILRTTPRDFLAAPAKGLRRFSLETDRYPFFRQFTYYSLLMGFPVTLYLFLYSILLFPLTRCVGPGTAVGTAVVLCVLSGILLLMPLWSGSGGDTEKGHPDRLLTSGRWQERVAGLKTIRQKRMDVSGFPSYQRMLASPHIPERYWLAKALSVNRGPETHEDLLRLLDDPSPSVVCMAFQSLGRRGDPRAIPEILNRIQTSDHWYPQWYAYRALKELGWRQGGLKQANNRIDNPLMEAYK
ncbi:MAG: HEAT repeat domain-containing protein [Deltaproteobacteria bacterium]|nr:HEAT repeat domain-containing protein [Deltaproteobacteria bacterium]